MHRISNSWDFNPSDENSSSIYEDKEETSSFESDDDSYKDISV